LDTEHLSALVAARTATNDAILHFPANSSRQRYQRPQSRRH
jgi:hypothetical protein